MFSLLAGWVRCCWRCSSVQCSTRGRPAPAPPPDARIPTTDVTTSHTPARARILLVHRREPPEAELSVLSRQCLDRRIPNKQALIEEVSAWEQDRNKNHTKADWQFTTADERIKLKRLYPAI